MADIGTMLWELLKRRPETMLATGLIEGSLSNKSVKAPPLTPLSTGLEALKRGSGALGALSMYDPKIPESLNTAFSGALQELQGIRKDPRAEQAFNTGFYKGMEKEGSKKAGMLMNGGEGEIGNTQPMPMNEQEEEPQSQNLLRKLLQGTGGVVQTFGEGFQQGLGIETQSQIQNKALAELLKESYQQDRLDQRERLKAGLEKDKKGGNAQSFKEDLGNLVKSFYNIPLPLRASATGAESVGADIFSTVTGVGKKEASEFDSLAAAALYSAASVIAKQEGREVTEKDIKNMQKVAGFKRGMRDADFKGKLQAVVSLVNSRVKNPEDKISVDELMSGVKGKAVSNIKSVTQVA